MKITVTQDDIDKGMQSNGIHCPVARAIRQHVSLSYVAVNRWTLYFRRSDAPSYQRTSLPASVNDFIRRYDNRQPVAPFEFDLNLDASEAM